jgi:lipopolysaccharide transport system ATP-binding protein
MSVAVSIQNLSKKYLLRHESRERYATLRDTISNTVKASGRRFRSVFRGGAPSSDASSVEEFWALKDVNLDVEHGERFGIIGRNGAGKSTLLKILSRIVEPTAGRVRIMGRVASLLEVGTGFHPELTGRENIFLNASILGMRRSEIRRKFDEIVDFADVERFLDTPVKRYSSGMYVRLAFAVAAHLEPDILVVDEVLAVGDAGFQRKCLGKMEQVTKEGRTLLFVSHSMPTITSLCRTAVLLDAGRVKKIGPTSDVVVDYYSNGLATPAAVDYANAGKTIGDQTARLLAGSIRNNRGEVCIEINITEPVTVEMQFEVLNNDDGLKFAPNFHFSSGDGICAFVSVDTTERVYGRGIYRAQCLVPKNFLNEGSYFVGLALTSFERGVKVHFFERSALSFNVRDPMEGVPTRSEWAGAIPGIVRPLLPWNTERLT